MSRTRFSVTNPQGANDMNEILSPRFSITAYGSGNASAGVCLVISGITGVILNIHELIFSIGGAIDTYFYQISRGASAAGGASQVNISPVAFDSAKTGRLLFGSVATYLGAGATKPTIGGEVVLIKQIMVASNNTTPPGSNAEPINRIAFKDPIIIRVGEVFAFAIGAVSGGGFPGAVAANVIYSEE